MKRILLKTGDIIVCTEPIIIETVLGSCVSVCLWDRKYRVGGMNHFLLPRPVCRMKNPLFCGTESIKMLINRFSVLGCNRNQIVAMIFGGNRPLQLFQQSFDVGLKNVAIAKEILSEHGIPVLEEFTCKDYGVKVSFYTDTGRVFVKRLTGEMHDQGAYN